MVTLRLFHQSDPFRQIERRDLAGGEVTVGRDPEVDWSIADPERALSRRHCVLAFTEGRLTLRDLSANGVFVGADRVRLPPGEAVPVKLGEPIRLGDYMILAEPPAAPGAHLEPPSFAPPPEPGERRVAFDAPFVRPILQDVEVTAGDLAVPSDWGAPARPAANDAPSPSAGTLLEAFCQGARLDVTAFAGDDPTEVMRQLGAVYQQMVLGLSDLMGERTSVKSEYRMSRTTVRAEGNNPLKWAPPQRVAVDLLRPRDDAFLTGPAAVKDAYQDLKKHLLCMLAGHRAALAETLEALSPASLEAQAGGRGFLPGARGAHLWSEYGKAYEAFRQQAADDPDSHPNRAFRAAYERQLESLDGASPPA